MIFERGFPQRLTAIDDLTRADHWYLQPDVCHFIGECTARKGLLYSATNRLILDFKMPVQHAGSPACRLNGGSRRPGGGGAARGGAPERAGGAGVRAHAAVEGQARPGV